MTDQLLELTDDTTRHGNVVATGVSADDYMDTYAEHFHEWVNGVVYKMSPASVTHQMLQQFLSDFIRVYLRQTIGGKVIIAPVVMRLDAIRSRREPDLMVILNDSLSRLQETYLEGPADIVIEIVSPSNESVDRVSKKSEYERGGVKEYWLFDPRHRETTFYHLDEAGKYVQIKPQNGVYTTPLLPKFKLDTDLLWQFPLPDILEVVDHIKAMLS